MDIVLENGEIVCIDGDARNLRISCRSGRLWVTQPHDPNDYLLMAGEQFVIGNRGKVAVTALDASSVHFSSPVSFRKFHLAWQVQLA